MDEIYALETPVSITKNRDARWETLEVFDLREFMEERWVQSREFGMA